MSARWEADCGVCGSTFGWPLDEQDDPPKHGVFCPQCRENGLSAPGVLHFEEVAAPTGETTELATLRAENARLREALEKIAARDFNCMPHQHGMVAQECALATIAPQGSRP